MIKTCEICGKEFEPNRSFQKYCSKECQRQGHLLKRREYYQIHKEECKAYSKQYRQKHREECKARSNTYRKLQHSKKTECSLAHGNCFECPTPDGECLYS